MIYNAKEFLNKNQDNTSPDVVKLFRRSASKMVKSLIVSNEAEAEQQAFEKGRAQRFKKNKNENEKNKICLHSFFFFWGWEEKWVEKITKLLSREIIIFPSLPLVLNKLKNKNKKERFRVWDRPSRDRWTS